MKSSNPPIVVRNAQIGDIGSVVQLHKTSFPGFFLTAMGDRFLRLLYNSFMQSGSSIFFVSEGEDGVLTGFCVGVVDPELFFGGLRRRKAFRFFFAAFPSLLMSPLLVIRKLFYALFYKGDSKAINGAKRVALLSSLAVDPEFRSLGLGAKLVEEFLAEAGKRDVDAVYLITDCSGNDKVNRFYASLGFNIDHTLTKPGNRVMNRYVQYLR